MIIVLKLPAFDFPKKYFNILNNFIIAQIEKNVNHKFSYFDINLNDDQRKKFLKEFIDIEGKMCYNNNDCKQESNQPVLRILNTEINGG